MALQQLKPGTINRAYVRARKRARRRNVLIFLMWAAPLALTAWVLFLASR